MGRFITIQAFLGFLALHQTLCAALQIPPPYESATAVVQTVSLDTVLAKSAPPAKRAPPAAPQMSNLGGDWGSTYVDQQTQPPGSTWARSDIRQLAKAGYEQVVAATGQANNMVAALFVPERGVYLGSIPHDGGQAAFAQDAPNHAPGLWGRIEGREYTRDATGNESKYHAEDMAMFWYEDRQQPQVIRGRYPEFSYMVVYGKKPNDRRADYQDPCGGPYARIRPNCMAVLRDLNVAFRR
jgi:hypothetical protein